MSVLQGRLWHLLPVQGILEALLPDRRSMWWIMGPAAPALTPGFFDKQHDCSEVKQTEFFPRSDQASTKKSKL